MAYVVQLIKLGALACVGGALAACSSLDLRGKTRSAALDPPAYSGYRRSPPPARSYKPPPARRRPAQRSDGIRYYKPDRYATLDRRRLPQPPRYQQPYVVPPRVERHTLPDVTVRRPRSTPQPGAEPHYVRTGWARWIGRSWRGHRTATGEMFDPVRLTGAHPSLPLPSFVYVTNRGNGRTILIRINDRAEAVPGRAIVVSQRAAELLDFRRQGRIKVDIQYAGPASPVPNERHEIAFLNRQSWYRRTPVAPPSTIARRAPSQSWQRTRRYPAPNYPRWDNTRR